MTTFDRFERELPEILEELYLGPTPDYRDDLLGRIAGTRQRPGWALSERWLPMDAISQRSTFMPPLPWRTIGAVALLILGLVVGVMLIAGGQRTRLPEPFGPAANGLIAFAANGDLFTVDPATGRTRALTTGPDTDRNPVWSRDGTRIVFERRVSGVQGVRLYIVRADGTDVRAIIPEPLAGFRSYVFSPDSREVLFDPEPGSESAFGVARVDGGGVRTIDVGMPAVDPAFRPPDGAEILFLGFPTWDREVAGVYVANADGSRRRTLVEPSRSRTVEAARWSPDGSRIAYSAADFTVQDWTVQVHVLDIDGSDDHTIPAPAGARWSGQAEWSNDGTRLAMYRGYSIRDDSDITIAVVPADGSGPGVQTDRSVLTGTPVYEWAPDDTSVLLMPPDWVLSGPFAPLVMDPRTGATQPADFESDSPPSMQRLAVEP